MHFHSRSTILTFHFFVLPTVDGALTLAQLEYNLPERPGCNLGDMVELLAATGLLQKEEINHGHQQQQQQKQQPRYCVNTGLPRTQVTTPTTILQDILEAQDDWRASQQRQAKLHAALKDQNTKPPRETLKAILLEFPDICQDPVYVAALRNLHVDVGLVATSFATPTPKKKTKRRKPSIGGGGKSKKAATSPKSTAPTPTTPATPATATTTAPATIAPATSETVASSAAMPPPRPPAEATKSTATMTTPTPTPTPTMTATPAPATTSVPAVTTTATSSSS
jgi:hypothetical protein